MIRTIHASGAVTGVSGQSRVVRSLTIAWLLASGCALQRAPLEPLGSADVPELDASRLEDALDAPAADVPDLDAPLDVPVCTPTAETCDRRDEDCNGVVDDTGCAVPSGACVGLTVAGIAYQSCPAITGLDGWRGACRQMGPAGYDLAVFPTPSDQAGVRDQMIALGLVEPHWVGLNDFEVNGTYVWLDRIAHATPPLPADPAKRCVVFRDGGYEELQCTESRRVLCSAPVSAPRCEVRDEIEACDRVDQDCDGRVDEGNQCGNSCDPHTFWDHAYYVCSTAATASAADERCGAFATGATLTSISHPTELSFALGIASGDSWVGLKQAGGASEAAGWGWNESTNEFGIPPSVPPWADGEPNDNGGGEDGEEDCGLIVRGRDGFDDRRCTDNLDFICEGAWSR